MFGQYSSDSVGKRTKGQMLADLANEGRTIDAKTARMVENNTLSYTDENGDKVIRLHRTDIIRIHAKGKKVTLFTGGYNTVTTRDRMRGYSPFSVYTEKGIAYVNTPVGRFPIGDSPITFSSDGKCLTKRALASVKQIEAYKLLLAKWIKKAVKGDISNPAGDPWLPLGKLPSKDVALDWLETGYVTRHAILSGIKWAGYQDVALAMTVHDLDNGRPVPSHFMNAVRRYFKAALKI